LVAARDWRQTTLLAARGSGRFLLVGQQSHFIHARRADRVDGILDRAELCTRVGTNKDRFARLVGQLIAHPGAQLGGSNLVLPQEHAAVAGNGDNDGIFLVRIGIDVGLSTLARSTFTLFCSMGVMTMKMISSTSITSTMGVTLMLALTLLPSFRTATAIVGLHALRICIPEGIRSL